MRFKNDNNIKETRAENNNEHCYGNSVAEVQKQTRIFILFVSKEVIFILVHARNEKMKSILNCVFRHQVNGILNILHAIPRAFVQKPHFTKGNMNDSYAGFLKMATQYYSLKSHSRPPPKWFEQKMPRHLSHPHCACKWN